MTDMEQLARDTLAASEKATEGPWKFEHGEIYSDANGIGNGPLISATDEDAELIALMRTAGPLLAQHVLDLREAVEQARGHLNVGSEAWEILDAALAEKEPRIKRAGEKHEDRSVPRYDHP